MSVVRMHRQLAGANITFFGDQVAVGVGFRPEGIQCLEQQFHFAQIQVQSGQEDGSLQWFAHKGSAQLHEKTILIDSVTGSETQLGVSVDGTTAEAIAILQSIWDALCSVVEAPRSSLVDVGIFGHSTVTIAELPKSFGQIFPLAARMAEWTAAGLAKNQSGHVGQPHYRLTIDIPQTLGGFDTPRTITIERRVTAANERVLFIESPLDTTQHATLLEMLCDSESPQD